MAQADGSAGMADALVESGAQVLVELLRVWVLRQHLIQHRAKLISQMDSVISEMMISPFGQLKLWAPSSGV